MLKFTCSFGLAWLGLCMAPLTAAVVFEDNFESYADTAAFQAVWGNAGLGTLDTVAGNPGQSAAHPGGTVNSRSFTPFTPTATEHLRLTGQIFDDGLNNTKRLSIGLRNGAANIIEMGLYTPVPYYSARVINFSSTPPSTNPNWVAFKDAGGSPLTQQVAGWHTFTVEIGDATVDFSLDLNSNGSIDSTLSFVSTATSVGFNNLRFGGPSDATSGGGGAKFDNLRLETIAVPEPTSAGVCALLGGLFMIRRRRR